MRQSVNWPMSYQCYSVVVISDYIRSSSDFRYGTLVNRVERYQYITQYRTTESVRNPAGVAVIRRTCKLIRDFFDFCFSLWRAVKVSSGSGGRALYHAPRRPEFARRPSLPPSKGWWLTRVNQTRLWRCKKSRNPIVSAWAQPSSGRARQVSPRPYRRV